MSSQRPALLESALDDVNLLLEHLDSAAAEWQPWIDRVAPEHRDGALNLARYCAMRQVDVRDLQRRLAGLGLNSLESAEAHVQQSLRAVALALSQMLGAAPLSASTADFAEGARVLNRNAEDLLGPRPAGRAARIMVTMPTQAATDPTLVAGLLDSGMEIARINCAHDDAQIWRAIAAQIADHTGRHCLIAMDLAGPKLRTGPIEPGPQIIRLRPTRDARGEVLVAARAWLTSAGAPAPSPRPGLPTVPVGGGWLRRLRAGDIIELRDTRRSRRWLEVEQICPVGVVVSCDQTVYLGTGTQLKVVGEEGASVIGELPAVTQFLRVRAGDTLRVTRDLSPAPASAEPARIGCTLPEVFDCAGVGDRVCFDDGKISGRIVEVAHASFDVRVDAPLEEAKLRAGKGVNVPDTDLRISALTDKDRADLAEIVALADIVQFSFVRDPADVEQLFDELDRLGASDLGVVLKIENRGAFENLPQLLLSAMRRRRVGVMIARGDLAVECGYERLAEVQEEILWLCEAAHIPVVWATQVLEQLAKSGVPSRAEISDAALAQRAECVMLNKGAHIADAVRALCDILARMTGHQDKKTALLRPLRSWESPAAAVGDTP
ncbi:pyruvate kinase [Mycolicibacterium brumae]|uniref:pyruvate kinase n=1 Tax=Mycolicibacterium brumae TaxID=85968 RepID=A0A2G5P8X4_9MYCO|nr:pyruvate kinase [Mycolicibacterium brumae]MCV7194791.1 hypothetical protein [Mycolicibacterium brumae]PIB74550.1 pyruvate kinase [Mycolicibacterium brumae]RWA19789.1 hypothetical protein MBRU_16510 [Mycolicibacterium brumae DSM 44177]UWW09566.1 pyruvate kinase [Mycolicibacterium brumae]